LVTEKRLSPLAATNSPLIKASVFSKLGSFNGIMALILFSGWQYRGLANRQQGYKAEKGEAIITTSPLIR
jgi:hypothetical protein